MCIVNRILFIVFLLVPLCLFAEKSNSSKIITVSNEINPTNSLIVDFFVQTNIPTKLKIYYRGLKTDTGTFLYMPQLKAYEEIHKFSIVRLRAQTEYEFQIIVEDQNNNSSLPYTGTFSTNSLPANLEEASIGLVQGTKTSYPLTIFDHNHNLLSPPPEQFDPPFYGMIIVDREGYIVWYYENKLQIPGRASKALGDIKQHNNNFYLQEGPASGGYDNRIFIMNSFGKILSASPKVCSLVAPTKKSSPPLTGGAHHEIQVLDDGVVLYLAHEVRYIKKLTNPLQNGSSIREWDPIKKVDQQVWSPFDFLNPITDRTLASDSIISLGCDESTQANEWTHSNTLSKGLAENYLWNSRNIDTLISLGREPDLRNPKIALCKPNKVKRKELACRQWRLSAHQQFSDFLFTNPADKFFHAHSAFQLPNADPMKTNILIYDNGTTRPPELGGEYSRALELELDFESMTAKKVWEYRYVPDIFTSVVGRVVRLENGHTLINFGSGSTPKFPYITHRIVEVDENKSIIAEINVYSPGKIAQYRANPLFSIASEIEI